MSSADQCMEPTRAISSLFASERPRSRGEHTHFLSRPSSHTLYSFPYRLPSSILLGHLGLEVCGSLRALDRLCSLSPTTEKLRFCPSPRSRTVCTSQSALNTVSRVPALFGPMLFAVFRTLPLTTSPPRPPPTLRWFPLTSHRSTLGTSSLTVAARSYTRLARLIFVTPFSYECISARG